MAQQQSQASAQQINAYNSGRVLNEAIPVIQKIGSFTQSQYPYSAGVATVINCPVLNVGLIRRFWVKVTANIQQGAAETQTLVNMGPANFLSQILLNDLNNLVRVNSCGWHLSMLSTVRRQLAFGAAFTSDSPFGYGSNYNIVKAPASVTAAANMYTYYEVPVSYGDTDTRGAIFANVVNASMNLQLTINPNLFQTVTGDAAQSVYQSSSAQLGKINSYTIDVYQEYWDQLPRNADGSFAIPAIDIATQYNLLNTTLTGLAVGSDFNMPYANFRSYMSTFALYDNGGTLNAGTDINYFSLSTANSMNIFKYDPFVAQLLNSRNMINDDMPKGLYYFSHRARPLTTLAFGNMSLNMNPSLVNANAQVVVGYEFFAFANQLQQASSINSN